MHSPQKARAESVAADSAPRDNQTQNDFMTVDGSVQPLDQDIANGRAFLQVLNRIAVALEDQNNNLLGINLAIQDFARCL